MTKPQSNFINMSRATLQVLAQQKPLWQTNKPITRIVSGITADLQQVDTALGSAASPGTGVTDDKEAAGDAAIRLAVNLAGYAEVYAREQNNQTLAQQLTVSFSSLDRLPDALLGPALRNLHARMAEQGSVLDEYGVTPAELTRLMAAIEKFENMSSAPRVTISNRKASNQSIPVIIRSLREHLQKLDNMMRSFAESQPQFYHSYKNARIIVDLGGRGGGSDQPDPPAA